MQRLNNIIANRAADTRFNRVLDMVSEAFTFPLGLRFSLRQRAIGRHARMLGQHLQMLEQHLTAGMTVLATAMSWRRSYAPCVVRIRHKHAALRTTRFGTSSFGRRG